MRRRSAWTRTDLLHELVLGELGIEFLASVDGEREVCLDLLKLCRRCLEAFLERGGHRVRRGERQAGRGREAAFCHCPPPSSARLLAMDDDYKASKEAFVSGMTGSSIGHINMVSFASLVRLLLLDAMS